MAIRSYIRRTQIVPENYGNPKWNQTLVIPVTVVRDKRHPFNLLQLQVLRFSGGEQQHEQVGSVSFHLHDIIKTSPASGCFDLFLEDSMSGELVLGVSFTYGLYGYGHNAQLKLDEMESTRPEDRLRLSLLPRVRPPDERLDENGLNLMPRAVRHPEFIPFNNQVIFGYGKNIASVLEQRKHGGDKKHVVRGPHGRRNSVSPRKASSLSPRSVVEDPESQRYSSDDDDPDAADGERFAPLIARMGRLLQLRNNMAAIKGKKNRLVFLHQHLLAASKKDERVFDHAPTTSSEADAHVRQQWMDLCHPATANMPSARGVFLRVRTNHERQTLNDVHIDIAEEKDNYIRGHRS